jgi:hypothetical protein
MEEYQRATGKDRKKKSILSKDLHTWSDVLEEVDNALKQYNKPDGEWGRIRKAFRKSGNKAGPASAWLALLPTQLDYFSVLCGGLSLITGVSDEMQVHWIL